MFLAQTIRSRFALIGIFCLLLSASAEIGFSQTSTATLTGIIQDSTGAIVPNVAVTATNTDRNTIQTTRTNETGAYVIPALNAGNYSVMAELQGFKKFERDAIPLQVNQTLRIDIRLDVGPIAETVQVTQATPMIETETSARGSVIDGKKILELPLNGRDYNQLALLSPASFLPHHD